MAMIILLLVNLVSPCINSKTLYANSVETVSKSRGTTTLLTVSCFIRLHVPQFPPGLTFLACL